MIVRITFLMVTISLAQSQLRDGYCELKCPISINIDIKCGSNGVSYQNEQELLCAKSLCYPDLYTSHSGYCNKNKSPANSQDQQDQHTNKLEDLSTTTRVINPSKKSYLGRSRTTNSIRDFEILHFQNDTNLNLKPSLSNSSPSSTTPKPRPKKRRPLGLTITSNDLPNKQYTYSKCLDECICDLMLWPVCGSNRITYGNKCIMECAQKCEPGLHYHHDGFCGKIFFSNPESQIKFFRAFSPEQGIIA